MTRFKVDILDSFGLTDSIVKAIASHNSKRYIIDINTIAQFIRFKKAEFENLYREVTMKMTAEANNTLCITISEYDKPLVRVYEEVISETSSAPTETVTTH